MLHLLTSSTPLLTLSSPFLSFLPPCSKQRLLLYQTSAAREARTRELKETEAFKQQDDGSGAMVLMVALQNDSIWAACNEAYATCLQGATEMWDKALERKMMMTYLLAPLYAHQDRPLFIATEVNMVFGHDVPKLSLLMKMYTRDGQTKLYLNSVRRVDMGEDRTGLIVRAEGRAKDAKGGAGIGIGGREGRA